MSDDGRAILDLPSANFADNSNRAMSQMLAHKDTFLGLGDGGAHCGLICDASLPTYMLQRWSTTGQGDIPLESVIKALTSETAAAFGLHDRGVIERGMRADLNVIDVSRIKLHTPV